MLLKRITLDNYGLYNGTVSFDLYPREKYGKLRPVVLFGGNNGAGKTTLFDAFRVVLYGKSALGDRVTEAEYKSFLKNRIHRSPQGLLQPQSASISLEFEHTSLGEKNTYIATRQWMPGNGKGVIERLSITKNGTQLRGVNPDYWQGFVEEIIPERLSSLFFFDGEKIKSIADDIHGNAALAESVKTLLGLDIVERLSSDLSIYKSRETLKNASKDLQQDISKAEVKISELEQQITITREELATNRTEQDGIRAEIAALELRLKREGHIFSQQRDALLDEKIKLAQQIESIRRAVREECEGLYPFSFCPTITAELKEQLVEEQKSRKGTILKDELVSMRQTILDTLASSQSELTSTPLFESIKNAFNNRIIEVAPEPNIEELFGFSDTATSQILHWIELANNQSRPKVAELSDKQEELTRRLQRVEQDLLRAPEEAAIQPLIEAVGSYNQRLGMVLQEQKKKEEELRSLEYRLTLEQRKLKRALEESDSKADEKRRILLANRIQEAMKDYADRLTTAKIAQLRTTVADRFNALSRKGDLIRNIDIDPVTYAVTLADRYGNVLPKEDLSAGEKQMYAVAMLWGLSITSGRSLPIIIDTPLGRLDSEHRGKLIHSYFPCAAEQVIILSTDTEIDKEWYAELSPNVSHSYHLRYNADENRTQVSNEYFWRG
ncbi:DNA sulfur modification protein DndD [Desulfovibrio mangrovi]|uniref:DNA sulfur modification protein DndD n=1 Tax=Desulfovibrio mangrovi TaxID=2976983 RepID=UPI0022466366|nr:DNA sulfur modification protein DndD [Desulfovibrio mangrovi]UZP67639.1 DNA sulfur modification protein DndD [Desulfovibrio mangrovi]